MRTPRALADGEVLELGGKRVRWIDTPHVPHGWDAGLLFEETTRTLFCGDLLSHLGADNVFSREVLEPAIAAENMFRSTSLMPATAPTIRELAALQPDVLAIMHGGSHSGDCTQALDAIADHYYHRLHDALASNT